MPSSLTRLCLGEDFLICESKPQTLACPSSWFLEHHLPASTLPHSGACQEADPSLASGKPWLPEILPARLQPALHTQEGVGPVGSKGTSIVAGRALLSHQALGS